MDIQLESADLFSTKTPPHDHQHHLPWGAALGFQAKG